MRLVETPTPSDFAILTRTIIGFMCYTFKYDEILQRGSDRLMKVRLDMELEVLTDLSASELASKMALVLQEVSESMKQSALSEFQFDIFLLLDGQEVRFVMEPV